MDFRHKAGFWEFEYDTPYDTTGIFVSGQIKGVTAFVLIGLAVSKGGFLTQFEIFCFAFSPLTCKGKS